MSNLKNTHVDVAGANVHLSVPFQRLMPRREWCMALQLWTTFDNQDELCYMRLLAAFEKFRGNIREMHDLKAVGKMVTFRKLYDADSGNMYISSALTFLREHRTLGKGS